MRKTLFLILVLFSALTCLTLPSSFAQSGDPDYTARLIYFVPRGNTPTSNMDKWFDEVLKGTQKFFADEMERHGYGRKTFKFETDRHGNAVVHHVTGRFKEPHYLLDSPGAIEEAVWEEIGTQFDRFQNIYLVVIDTVAEAAVCGAGGASGPASGNLIIHLECFDVEVTAHEFGHAFRLAHDFRNDAYIMSYGGHRDELSPCDAEWLDVHSYFNTPPPHFNNNTEIEMAPPVVSPPHAIRLRFMITDPDGLHQAQLEIQENHDDPDSALGGFLECASLKGPRETVEFVTTELEIGGKNQVTLKVIDVDGNFTAREFEIDVTDLVPRSRAVSIPDANLAAGVRETLELAPSVRIKQLDMLKLTSLQAEGHQITNLTGLEHAKNLKSLRLGANQIRDVTPLAGLTQLKFLELYQNQISDLTPLVGLRNLTDLNLVGNQISDIHPLIPLTQLRDLRLEANQIRDVTPLTELRNLTDLNLASNQISDIHPLIALTQLEFLKFAGNPISDATSLQTLRQHNPELLSDAEPKIEGPWLWMIVPRAQKIVTNASALEKDYLAAASNGTVTEKQIATEGATAGDKVGEKEWTRGWLPPTGEDNINEAINATGLGRGNIQHHVAYGSIVLDSPQEQNTYMYVGSDDNHKVWLNGALVHEQLEWEWGHDYQTSVPITLKRGKNVLLVAVEDEEGPWGGYFGFRHGTVYSIINDIPPEAAIRADPVEAGPKIEGPWLWIIAPALQRVGIDPEAPAEDWLATASGGSVTEAQIAVNGATAGERVRDKVWTLGKLAPEAADNVGKLVNTIGLAEGSVDYHVAYGSVVLKSPRKQKTWMYAGSDDNHKVWLNGELVRERLDWHWNHDYQESFPVTLKKGKNVLLVAIQNGASRWSGYFGFESDAAYSVLLPPTVHIGPAHRPPMYWIDAKAGTFHRLVGDDAESFLPRVQNATGLVLEPTSRKMYWTEDTGGDTGAVKRANVDGSNLQLLTTLQSVPTSIAVHAANGKLYWTNARGRIQQANRDGQGIRNLIQNLKDPGNMTVDATGGKIYWTEGKNRIRRANLNGKSVQNVANGLESIGGIAIAGNTIYWTEGTGEDSGKLSRANLNGSNARMLAELQHVPCCIAVDPVGSKLYWTDADGNIRSSNLNGEDVQDVASSLASAIALVLGTVEDTPAAPMNSSLVSSDAGVPATTHLLTNYPNPFNPETWIPYQLSKAAEVALTIYDIQGRVVRTLDLGHQRAGVYQNKGRAAYWDGRNAQGEPVASGLYFYTLKAGDFIATRKMLIRK